VKAHRSILLVALAALATTSAAAQEFDGGQAFDMPSASFGDASDLGKYNYLGRVPGDFQLPGEGAPFTVDGKTLAKFYKCPKGTCVKYGYSPGYKVQLPEYGYTFTDDAAVAAPVTATPPVASDEIRLDNPQAVQLGLRLTVGGLATAISIGATGSFTRKLATGETAVAEISSGDFVSTASLQPGRAYEIRIVNGVYFVVPVN